MTNFANSTTIKRKRIALTTAFVACLLLVIPSCRIPGLSVADPPAPMPDSFRGAWSTENSAQVPLDEFLNNPTLMSLIDQAMYQNQELKILEQDIQIANFEIMARRGAYLPFVTFGGGAGLDKPSLYTPLGAAEDQLSSPAGPFPDPLPNFLVSADVTWQIDIWRQLRNARDAAGMRYLGTFDGRNYVVTRLAADIAENYFELLALDNRIETLNRTIQLQQQSRAIAIANKAAARGTELAVQRFQADVRKNQSEKLILTQQIIETENRINFLCGRFPQPVPRFSADFYNMQLHPLSVGVPAQLLQNRPDIRQAERELQASGLDVRVARARFYPQLNIRAGVGYQAFNPKYLFITPESLIYNVAADLTAPLINRAAIKADYLSANARQMQAVYNYQRITLRAFTEVTNRINKIQNYGTSLALRRQQLDSLEASVTAATQLFQNARAEYVDVLLSQRDLQTAKLDLIDTKQQQLSAIVNAYQALGGGLRRNPPGTIIGPPPGLVPAPPVEVVPAPPGEAIPAPQPAPVPAPAP
jgi:NodT family efflux transporter outer membrane factor (OMF) lipoprotein